MVIMNLVIDNLYAFKDFHINMSYPKRIVDSAIENEHLEGYSNFRYKKVIVLMGANASGKTSLGRAMLDIFSFIDKKDYDRLISRINDRDRETYFSVDFVESGSNLIRVEALIDVAEVHKSEHIHVCVQKQKIKCSDNYERCSGRFEKADFQHAGNYIEVLEQISPLNWMFEFTLSPEKRKQYVLGSNDKYPKVLSSVLKTLDPRIERVTAVEGSDDSYAIKFPNAYVYLYDGELVDRNNVLSSGTKEGIGVANVIASIKSGEYGFVYCDEKLSHIHSETEKTFLSVMIECLGADGQLIYTTHNTDILDMNLPKHTFAFLRRSRDGENRISCVYASEYLKKSTESLRNAVENDLFATLPDDAMLYALADI